GSFSMESSAENATAGDALLAAARAGDASALWRLTESYRPYLRGVVARMLGPQLAAKVDASDVVQHACLRPLNSSPSSAATQPSSGTTGSWRWCATRHASWCATGTKSAATCAANNP